MNEEEKQSPIRPADALGTLSKRSQGSKVAAVVIAVVGFLGLALLAGLLFGGAGSGNEIPDVPQVEL